jgi:hypothetical protein
VRAPAACCGPACRMVMWQNYLVAADVARAKPMGRRERELAEIRCHVWMDFRDLCTERSTFKSMGHFHKWHWDEV